MKESRGRVLEIQRMSTEDGPGLRTTVFMKGCSLKCLWCHNPESIKPGIQVEWFATKCIGCNLCIDVCDQDALRREEGAVFIDRNSCADCTRCADICPSGALTKIGSFWDVEMLAQELLKDRTYFDKSGGGITVSGGEPALQSDFVLSLLKRIKEEGIHTALDSCGAADPAAFKSLLPYVDLILFDLKQADSTLHWEHTGQGNSTVIENFSLACNSGTPLWIRTPVIPGCTDSPENIRGIASVIKDHNKQETIHKWELLAFNNLCADKYKRLGLDWSFANKGILEEETMIKLHNLAQENLPGNSGLEILWSGSVANPLQR